jgi:hypothetical protein
MLVLNYQDNNLSNYNICLTNHYMTTTRLVCCEKNTIMLIYHKQLIDRAARDIFEMHRCGRLHKSSFYILYIVHI